MASQQALFKANFLRYFDVRQGRCNRIQFLAAFVMMSPLYFLESYSVTAFAPSSFVYIFVLYIQWLFMARRIQDLNYSAKIFSIVFSVYMFLLLFNLTMAAGYAFLHNFAFPGIIIGLCSAVIGSLSILISILQFSLFFMAGTAGANKFGAAPVGLRFSTMISHTPPYIPEPINNPYDPEALHLDDMVKFLDIRFGRCNRMQALFVCFVVFLIMNVNAYFFGNLTVAIVAFYLFSVIMARRLRDINFSAMILIVPLIVLAAFSLIFTELGPRYWALDTSTFDRVAGTAGILAFQAALWVLPVVALALLFLLSSAGSPGRNQYGPAPVGLRLITMVNGGQDAFGDVSDSAAPWRTKDETGWQVTAEPEPVKKNLLISKPDFPRLTPRHFVDLVFKIMFAIFCLYAVLGIAVYVWESIRY